MTRPFRCLLGLTVKWGGNSSTAGVYAARVKLREALARNVGFDSNDAEFADGEIRSGAHGVPLAKAAGVTGTVAEDAMEYGDLDKRYQQSTFGAHFVEVGVDAATGEIPTVGALLPLARCRSIAIFGKNGRHATISH